MKNIQSDDHLAMSSGFQGLIDPVTSADPITSQRPAHSLSYGPITIANVLALIAALLTSRLGPCILFPGLDLSVNGNGIMYMISFPFGVIFALIALIVAIVAAHKAEKYNMTSAKAMIIRSSKYILIPVCVVEMAPSLMLFLAIPVVLFDIIAHAVAIIIIKRNGQKQESLKG